MRNVLVVGGSRGIGLALAESFLSDGDNVVVVSRTAHLTPYRERLVSIGGDVREPYAWLGAFGTPRAYDVVINAAGLNDAVKSTIPRFVRERETVSVNVYGTIALTNAVADKMNEGGSIVHFSGAGVGGPRHLESPAYTATKAAVVQFVEVASSELAALKVTINAIAPGKVATEMTGGQGGGPERAIALVKFLCSPEARHVSGRLLAARDDLERLKQPMTDDDYRLRRVVPS